ncbi:MAG: type II secretion system F family protein [Myxococcales bacterium]
MPSSVFLQFVAAGAALFAAAAVTLLARAALPAVAALGTFRGTVVRAVADASGRVLPGRWRAAIAAALRRAGSPCAVSPDELVALVLLSAGTLLGPGGYACFRLGLGPLAIPCSAVCGAAVPLLWVRDRARARRAAMARALPYHLDLLTLSVEAGLDFAAALAKVVEKAREGPLSDELSIALKELRLGRVREDALRDLAARAGMPALTSFAHALAQADRMGTPLGKVLRVLSAQMRAERTQRAEKLAGEAPVKLLLPLIGCIFPTLFLMLFGPIAYQMFLGGDF